MGYAVQPPLCSCIPFVFFGIKGHEHSRLSRQERYPTRGMTSVCGAGSDHGDQITTLLGNRKRIKFTLDQYDRRASEQQTLCQVQAIGTTSHLKIPPLPRSIPLFPNGHPPNAAL